MTPPPTLDAREQKMICRSVRKSSPLGKVPRYAHRDERGAVSTLSYCLCWVNMRHPKMKT